MARRVSSLPAKADHWRLAVLFRANGLAECLISALAEVHPEPMEEHGRTNGHTAKSRGSIPFWLGSGPPAFFSRRDPGPSVCHRFAGAVFEDVVDSSRLSSLGARQFRFLNYPERLVCQPPQGCRSEEQSVAFPTGDTSVQAHPGDGEPGRSWYSLPASFCVASRPRLPV